MIAWTIAGSDSGGGAGIQADLKAFAGLGAHGCSVITALTAQNSRGVNRVNPTPLDMVTAQFQALANDLHPVAVKTGMLPDAQTVRLVANHLADLNCFVVCDPVIAASSGQDLSMPQTQQAMIEGLFPVVDLLTPNLPEARLLTGLPIQEQAEIPKAAEALLHMGVGSVLMKGGHSNGAFCQDYFTDGKQSWWLTTPRIVTLHSHGSGCTLSAAITGALALGYELEDALVIGRTYVNRGLRLARPLGQGPGPVVHGGWPEDSSDDLPWLTLDALAGQHRPNFPDCGPEPLGFYPIFDSVAWLERLLPLGIKTVQMRIKDLEGQALKDELAQAHALCQTHGTRLFINDYWELAIELGAYGVHLGQEDLLTADITAIARAGLRLGLSTHCYGEVARALAVRPSYMAIGPVYATTTKEMRFEPQGLDNLRRWRKSLDYPLVAIGGINLERAVQVLEYGADSLAVITAITHARSPENAVKSWLSLF